jgi:endonuclease/exonuclease/phosphatase family metal-dependent hydrolase
VPLVFTHHTMYEQYTHYVPGDSHLLARFVVDLTVGYSNLCDAVIAPSESVTAILQERGVVTAIESIPTGVDVAHFASGDGASFRRELNIPAGAFVVGHLGRLAPEKNLPFLAQAVAAFLRRHPKTHFLVVGSGPSEEPLRALFRSARYRGRLHMAGSCSGQRLIDAYHAMDVFAFASQSETQGMVLTEAMAAGVPVVAVDAAGAREVVVDRVNGRLLPNERQASFADALAWVAHRSAAEREALRQAARRTADEFSMQRTADKALALYERLAAGAASGKSGDISGWESSLRWIEAEWDLWSNLAEAARTNLESHHFMRVPVIGTALFGWQRIRRWLSRSEWGAWLLGLPPSTSRAERGLILVQIDGLSRAQMEQAIKRRKMPFLRKLLGREGYRLHTLYSGLPSTTSAVQGELFYGVKAAVPAFGFADRSQGRLLTMLDPPTAAAVQQRAARHRLGLLEGGSAFCNPYTGGAAEAHFCASAIGWGDLLRYANPVRVLLFLLLNLAPILRMAGLVVLEVVLALIDCVRGYFRGQDLVKELKFIPSRVGISIALRDLMTIGASMDATRGLPVIQLNYVGYDEQSHRRGPGSRFAHWSLKGIDRSIRRVWDAARQSSRRDYTVWVYSDHGQERTVAYQKIAGRTIQEAVAEIVEDIRKAPTPARAGSGRGTQAQRVRYLGGRLPERLIPRAARESTEPHPGEILVSAEGPAGHIYLPFALSPPDLDRCARWLAKEGQVPLVLALDGPDALRAWTSDGDFRLPYDAARIFGDDHPFLQEVPGDLLTLCRHPDAGDLVILGWRLGAKPVSFAWENGAHGGASPEETRAFALLPSDTALPETDRDYLRPADVRRAGLDVLGRGDVVRRPRRRRAARDTVRIVTYNVHSCVGMDGRLSAARIARVLAQCEADVVALQELDVRRARSRHRDQAHEIARDLEMEFHFHPALQVEEEQYGDAVLSRFPMRLVRAGGLPGSTLARGLEPRGALWVSIDLGGRELQLINTHLGLLAKERDVQAEALLGPQWLGSPDCRGPVVLCGDFNAPPGTVPYRRIAQRLSDAQLANGRKPGKTWLSHYPVRRIDHIFLGDGLEVTEVAIPSGRLVRTASDHLPLVVEVRLKA